MPDWLFEVAVPAVTGGAVAYVTTIAQTRGEVRKLRAEHDEAHYSHRQANYHNLLNAERRMFAVLREGKQPGGPRGWTEITDNFRDCVNGVIISGSDAAVSLARALDHVYFGARSQFGANLGFETVDWEDRDRQRRAFIDAVRGDLGAPGSRRI